MLDASDILNCSEKGWNTDCGFWQISPGGTFFSPSLSVLPFKKSSYAYYWASKEKTMVDVIKPLFVQETSVFRMRCTLCIEIGTISSLAYHRAEWKLELSSSWLHTLGHGNRSADFTFPCFMLIIIPILVANAIICDTKPEPRLHRTHVLRDVSYYFNQKYSLNSKNQKLSPETVNGLG